MLVRAIVFAVNAVEWKRLGNPGLDETKEPRRRCVYCLAGPCGSATAQGYAERLS